jgi:hypothetical protein
MAIQLEKEVIELLADKDTVKILTTIDNKGVPHTVIKQSLHLGEDGNLIHRELLESSQTNKNLVRSIWFNHKVAITLKGTDGRSYQIKGKPIRAIISGPVFQEQYLQVRERLGDVDLAAVWIIEPEEIRNETYFVRKNQEEADHPYFKHLDRLAK